MSMMKARKDLCLSQESLNLAEIESVDDNPASDLYTESIFTATTEICVTSFNSQRLNMKTKSPSQLKAETQAKQKKIDEQVALAEKTYLCFFIDCTGSMSPWINKVKDNIKYWSTRLHAKYTNMELLVAFVRYTDYDQPEKSRTTTLNFTRNLDQVHHFVDTITTPAGVGGDIAEDVFGGLDAVLKLSWPRDGTKVMIHITDAPCHGKQYHGPGSKVSDNYPEGDPAGLQLDDLMRQFAKKEISYYFGYIKKAHTQAMTTAFNFSLRAVSKGVHSIQQFDAQDPNKLLEGVFRSVTCSIMTTIEILTTGGARALHQYTIKEDKPDWTTMSTKSVLVTPPPTTGSAVKREVPSQPMNVKIASQPFSEGGQKIVYHAFDVDKKKHIVLKRSKWADPRSNCLKRSLETVQVHAVAANLSAEFNRQRPIDSIASEIQFLPVGVMQVTENEYFTYEQYLAPKESSYRKFNSSFHHIPEEEMVNDLSQKTCNAFSHYTWKESGKKLVVCDLQGMAIGSRVVLTDPVIHFTMVLCHGSTNLGTKGIEQFFKNHKCNEICQEMDLIHPNEAKEQDE